MSLTVERSDARPWADGDLEPLFEGAFPTFITADQAAKAYVGRVREWFAGLNIIVVEDGQIPVATGWAVPVQWDGSLPGLPDGYTDTLRRAVEAHETGQQPDTLVICGGIVHPDRTGQGLAAHLLTALRSLAPQAGCQKILAPVRPTLAGWVRYYGRFYPSKLREELRTIDAFIVRWVSRKYKRFRGHTLAAWNWLRSLKRRNPDMFAHWTLGPAAG